MSLKLLKFRPQLPDKLKGTIVERWVNYWKGLARDYKEVSKDSIKFIKENPVKSSIYGTVGVFSLVCYKTNPNYHHFTDEIRSSQNQLGLVYQDSQNIKTLNFLKYLEQCRNEERIRLSSYLLFSVVWSHDHSSNLSTTDATCQYLQPEYSKMFDRIVDIGFMGKWWNIERHMRDYDVNVY